jgi:hypothetical protein
LEKEVILKKIKLVKNPAMIKIIKRRNPPKKIKLIIIETVKLGSKKLIIANIGPRGAISITMI